MTPEFFYMKLIPYILFMFIGMFTLLLFSLPRAVRILLWCKITKRQVTAVFLSNDDGYTFLEVMKGDLGQGILSGEGDKINYILTPRPTVDDIPQWDAQERRTVMRALQDIPLRDKTMIDDYLTAKHFMKGFGVPVYFGYLGKSVAVSPKILDLLGKVNANIQHGELVTKTRWEYIDPQVVPMIEDPADSSKQIPHPDPDTVLQIEDPANPGAWVWDPAFLHEVSYEVYEDADLFELHFMDPRSLKKYIPWTINPAMIDSIEFHAEQYGYLGRPLSQQLKPFILPVGIIMMIVVGYLMYSKGLF